MVDFRQEMRMETSLAGQEMLSEADLGIELLWQVEAASQDFSIRQSIERVKLSMTSPGYPPVEYDSRNTQDASPVAETIGKTVQPLLGVGFNQEMDARGRITRVTVVNEQKKSPSAAAALNPAFSEDGLKDLLTQAAATLPEGPVNPGDSWDARSEVASPVGKLVMNIQYTYRGVEAHEGKSLDRIDVNVEMRFDDGPNAIGMPVKIAEQACSGVVYFDNQRGRLDHSEIHRRVVTETQIGDQVHRHLVDTGLQLRLREVNAMASLPAAARK
ncbi:MAG: DUF6263 family protein [Planctomycetota bacterium]